MDKPVPQIQPVKLESINDFNRTDYDGKIAVAVGWGSVLGYLAGIEPIYRGSNILKKVNLPVISRSKCMDIHFRENSKDTTDITQGGKAICTQSLNAEGVCQVNISFDHFRFPFSSITKLDSYCMSQLSEQGDSGGPLFVDGVQIGITSFGLGCADR